MFGSKKKLTLEYEELRVIIYALTDFRNNLLKNNEYVDSIDEIFPKLNKKMKLNKYELRVIMNGLYQKRNELLSNNEDASEIEKLTLKIIDILDTFK